MAAARFDALFQWIHCVWLNHCKVILKKKEIDIAFLDLPLVEI